MALATTALFYAMSQAEEARVPVITILLTVAVDMMAWVSIAAVFTGP